jgi:hypothetical protein
MVKLGQYLPSAPKTPLLHATLPHDRGTIAVRIRTRKDQYRDETTHLINPLLDWGFTDWVGDTENNVYGVYEEAFGPTEDPPVFFNPIMLQADKLLNYWKWLPWNVRPDVWRRKDASWRRMEVTQPPVQTLRLEDIGGERDDFGDAYIREAEMSFKSGSTLKMGAL